MTATILKALHPNSRDFNTDFEAASLPDRMFDLAISNVWLPETAFEENAGTKVVTDILILPKRIDEIEVVPP